MKSLSGTRFHSAIKSGEARRKQGREEPRLKQLTNCGSLQQIAQLAFAWLRVFADASFQQSCAIAQSSCARTTKTRTADSGAEIS
jgi:hypothetical protein